MTLRWRLTLFYTTLAVTLLALVTFVTLVTLRSTLVAQMDRDLQATYAEFVKVLPELGEQYTAATLLDPATQIPSGYRFFDYAVQVELAPPFPDQASLSAALEEAGSAQERSNLLSLTRDWQTESRKLLKIDPASPIVLSDAELEALISAPDGQLIIERNVQEPIPTEPTPMRVLVRLAPLQWSLPTQGLPPAGETLTFLYVGRSLEQIEGTLNNLEAINLVLLLLGALTAGTGAYLLAGQALYPLRRVQQAAERIGGRNLGERVPEPGTGDEVDSLARALNGMLGRLEASFEAQRRFTSDASHELRTPVTAIKGHAGYLLRRTNPTGQQRESLHIIQSESERLTNLIASLLELARSDSGVLTLQKAPVFSALLLGDIARELEPLAQAQHTTLRVEGPDLVFEADPARLKQVLINLVSNALKAGASTITLRSAQAPQAGQLVLSVEDDGPGIPRDQLERLFDRFYRLEDSRSRDVGGAGLGLSIARGIVEAHGGRIWLESQPGHGTTAHVQLPVGHLEPLEEEDVP